MTEWTTHRTDSGEQFLILASLSAAGLQHVFTLRPASRPLLGEPDAALEAAGFRPQIVARPRQVHGALVARVHGSGPATFPAEADGILVDRPGQAAAVATADCVGGILFAPGTRAFVVFHAGWRGILAGIVEVSVNSLAEATSMAASGMILATGPAVGKCCYEVGEEVERPFAALFSTDRERAEVFGSRDSKRTIDPPAAVGLLAVRAGLRPGSISRCGLCTMCRSDLCWSWRVQGRGAGRMWAAAALQAR